MAKSYNAPRVPQVDQVGVDERARRFASRSIKTSAKELGLKMTVSMMDLTTLEGKDTPGKVRSRRGVFGADSRAVFQSAGLDDAAFDRLAADGIVFDTPPTKGGAS